MSSQQIPYPPDFDVNYHADLHEERRRRALAQIDPGDVIAVVEEMLASEPSPAEHPLFPVVNWLLDHQVAVDGGQFWDAWKALVSQAIDSLVEVKLADPTGWED
jgi:hypothetical protein